MGLNTENQERLHGNTQCTFAENQIVEKMSIPESAVCQEKIRIKPV